MTDLVTPGQAAYVDALVAATPFNPGRGSEAFWRTTTYHLLAGVKQLVLAAGDPEPSINLVVALARSPDRLAEVVARGLAVLRTGSFEDCALASFLADWSEEWVSTDSNVRRVLLEGLDVAAGLRLTRRSIGVEEAGSVLLGDRVGSWDGYDALLLPEAAREALDVGRARLACHRVRPVTESESERAVLGHVACGRFSA